MNWETYIAFGDSITKGARSYLGYPEILGSRLEKSLLKKWVVVNNSVSGFKAIDLSRHIDQHFSSLKEFNANISTVMVGTNDIKEDTDTDDFITAFGQVVLKAKLLTVNKNVVVLAIPYFQKGIMYPYTIDMNERIRTFNDKIKETAQINSVRIFEAILDEADFYDGVHLNVKGCNSVATQLGDFILKDKGFPVG